MFSCSFSEAIKLQVDMFGIKGEETLLVFSINLLKRLNKAAEIGIHDRSTADERSDIMEL